MKRKHCMGHGFAANTTGLEHARSPVKCQNLEPSNNDILSTAHINLMEEFVAFCKCKKANQVPQCSEHPKKKIHEEPFVDKDKFKENLILSYGDHLPVDVIDQLCQLVHQNSGFKCLSCSFPVENLVMRVLQILSDAASKKYDNENINVQLNGIPHISIPASTARVEAELECAKELTNTRVILAPQCNDYAHIEGSHGQTNQTPIEVMPPNNVGNGLCPRNALEQCIDPSIVADKMKPTTSQPHEDYCHTVEHHDFKECTANLMSKLSKDGLPVLDTPLCIPHKLSNLNCLVSFPEPVDHINKRFKPTRQVSHTCRPATKLFQDQDVHAHYGDGGEGKQEVRAKFQNVKASPEIKFIGEKIFKDRCSELGKLTDQLYNQKNLSNSGSKQAVMPTTGDPVVRPHSKMTTQIPPRPDCLLSVPNQNPANTFEPHTTSSRFPVNDTERRYYSVLCGLAHSQWNCFPAVKFFKTSVTYSSLGVSVEPNGHVDNFFTAGMCRKFFEDLHPRRSKKHYFYPKVGSSLLSYSSLFDINVMKNSVIGANSAHKLHLSYKLCFPICKDEHWFVFIVDLKNKLFAFLDSYYGESDNYQVQARSKLINSFKECWYEYADVKLDLEDFTEVYPTVPKQYNLHDCGIFAIKFMESWENNIDLRQVFNHLDIPNIRIKLVISLFFSGTNSVDKALGIDPRLCN